MKEKNTLWLCMRYSGSCKLCPKSSKCDSEVVKPRLEEKGKIIKLIIKK